MFVYSLDPIDFWHGWMSEDEYRRQMFADFGGDAGYAARQWEEYEAFKTKAFDLAKELGWEGDIRKGERLNIAGLPVPNETKIMLAWKQDNNGTTFIASPFQLPWLAGNDLQIEG